VSHRQRSADTRSCGSDPDGFHALLVVPPFALADRPSLSVHVLQACARAAGFRVGVEYVNLHLAAAIGPSLYDAICRVHSHRIFLGERFFCQAAFGGELLGSDHHHLESRLRSIRDARDHGLSWSDYRAAAAGAAAWLRRTAETIVGIGAPVVGATSSFQQTGAAVGLLDHVKRLDPSVITILGGANCAGEMAAAIAPISASIDFVFSGDCEASFPDFLARLRIGRPPGDRIVRGAPCRDLDLMPTPDYSEFFEQLSRWLPDARRGDVWLPYESSRGCWWGQRRRCSFCGLNTVEARFRTKPAARVVRDLSLLEARHPECRVAMTDNVMPRSFFTSLIPMLAQSGSRQRIFYELRAGATLAQMAALQRARVTTVQAGIEALAPGLLRLLSKGVTPAENIALLRYGRSLKIAVLWNMLYEIPGDTVQDYESTAALLPLIRHLAPPRSLGAVSIDRFSRYFESPEDFGITNVEPFEEYSGCFPPASDLAGLAYYFDGDFASGSRDHPEIIDRIDREITTTRRLWEDSAGPPLLHVHRLGNTSYLLTDSRGVAAGHRHRMIDADQACAALAHGPAIPRSAVDWAIRRKVAVLIEDRYIPLATAAPELLAFFEDRSRRTAREVVPAAS